MPIEYAEIILAVVALFAGILYLRVRRTRSKGKKNKNAVRPASPSRTGIASQPAEPQQPAVQTWAPPVTAPRPGSVASTVIQAPPQPARVLRSDTAAAVPRGKRGTAGSFSEGLGRGGAR